MLDSLLLFFTPFVTVFLLSLILSSSLSKAFTRVSCNFVLLVDCHCYRHMSDFSSPITVSSEKGVLFSSSADCESAQETSVSITEWNSYKAKYEGSKSRWGEGEEKNKKVVKCTHSQLRKNRREREKINYTVSESGEERRREKETLYLMKRSKRMRFNWCTNRLH